MYDLVRFIETPVTARFRGGVSVGQTYEFIQIVQLAKNVKFSKNRMDLYE